MKKIMRTYLTAFATTALLFAAASCDSLQDSLSSEQNAKVLEETGTPSLADKVWYYNGTATQDVTGSAGYLKIDYGQQIRESSAGISGSFVISYTDAQTGNVTTVTKSLSGGFVSEDGTSYCLDMTPVIKMLNYSKTTSSATGKTTVTQTFKDGTADVTVTLSGLICNAGDQKGRSISALSKKVSVQPLYTKAALETNVCDTTGATAGTKFSVSVQGASTVALQDTNIAVTGDDIPEDVYFSLDSISDDGKTIYFVADEDLSGKAFKADVKVYGITPKTSGISYTQTFSTVFASVTMSDEATVHNDPSGKNNAPLRDVLVYNDASNLYVRVDFDDDAKLWHHNNLTILLDNASVSTGAAATTADKTTKTDSTSPGIASGTITFAEGSSVEAQICTSVTGSDAGGGANGITTTSTGNNATSDMDSNPPIAQYAFMPTSVTYTIPLADVGGLTAGNTVYVFVAVSPRDNDTTGTVGLMNWITEAAVTEKKSSLDWEMGLLYDTVTIDMTKALSHTVTKSE